MTTIKYIIMSFLWPEISTSLTIQKTDVPYDFKYSHFTLRTSVSQGLKTEMIRWFAQKKKKGINI